MRSILAAALGLALAGCTVYSSPKPVDCPGTLVAILRFSGRVDPAASTCTFATDSNVIKQDPGFTGEVHWDPAGTDAAICIPEPHAVPHVGTHAGNDLTVTFVDLGTAIPTCSCAVEIVETIAGTLQLQGTTVTGFAGTMTNEVRTDPSLAATCGCVLPCVVGYTLTGSL
jgi:hypothetical protein